MNNEAVLCIGGPLAGQRRVVRGDRDSFRVPISPGPPVTDFSHLSEPAPPQIQHIDYWSQTIAGASFWVPAGQSYIQTMRLLLEAYARSPKEVR